MGLLLLLASGAVAFHLFTRPRKILTEKDTVVLADFVNTTGDPVFEGTLRQGLTVQLEQSPFPNVIPEERIQQTLSLMGQPAGTRLTPVIAQEICERTGSAAVFAGSIAPLGSHYVLGLQPRIATTERFWSKIRSKQQKRKMC